MTSTVGSLPFERLKGRENFDNWEIGARSWLVIKSMWKWTQTEPAENNATDKASDLKALSELTLLLDPSIYSYISKKDTTKQAWDSLQSSFKDSGTCRKVATLQQFVSLKYEDCASMEEYVTKMNQLYGKVQVAGFNIDEEVAGSLMLAGLPSEYKPMILGIENSAKTITVDFVKTLLLQEVIVNKSENSDGALVAKTGKKKTVNNHKVECFNCKGNHFAKNCPQKKSNKNSKSNGKRENLLIASLVAKEQSSLDWIIDSGATAHMTKFESVLLNKCAIEKKNVIVANNNSIDIKSIGDVKHEVIINGQSSDIVIKNVHYVPNICANLLSVRQIVANENKVVFDKNGCRIYNKEKELIATGSIVDDMFKLDIADNKCERSFISKSSEKLVLWHRRLGHVNYHNMDFLTECVGNVKEIPESQCVTCVKGKQTRLPFSDEGSRATTLLELVHSDVCGPIQVQSFGGHRYFVTFIDDYSRRVFVYVMKNKNEVFECFKIFKKYAENQTGFTLKKLRSDNGKEYCNKSFVDFCRKNGIEHQKSAPYSPQQNGLAERMNRTLLDKVRCMLIDSALSKAFWAEALMTAEHIINCIPCKGTNPLTPHEIFSGHQPNYGRLKVFGCRAMVHVTDSKRQKLDPKSVECIFLGYEANTKAYRLYNKKTKKIVVSRDVIFIENEVLNENRVSEPKSLDNVCIPIDDENLDITESGENGCNPSIVEISGDSREIMPGDLEVSGEGFESAGEEQVSEFVPDVDVSTVEPRLRSTRNLEKPKPKYTYYALHVHDPVSVAEAMNDMDAKSWKSAMKEEMASLAQNETWELAKLPAGKKAIKSKWIFKRKRDSQGKVLKFKARLVAKGFSQVEGIDYNETYSPVVRYASIRYLFALAAKLDLDIRQMDAVTAFLNGKLNEIIYMEQPEGFHDGTNRYCKLHKSIYGLKQSSKVWNDTLNDVLIKFGLIRSTTDQCIYFSICKENVLIVAIYVDDLLLFSNSKAHEEKLVKELSKHFKMKDLGEVSSVLGMRVIRDRKARKISIDQKQYIREILIRFGMEDCNGVSNPMDPNQKLSSSMGPRNDKEKDEMKTTPYRQLVGSLLFAAQISRPDISYAVNVLSRFNNDPGQPHWAAAKRVLRYLKATINHRITYGGSLRDLQGFCDADWGSDPDDRRSTSGYVFTMQGGAVSWSTRRQPTVALSSTEAEFMSLVSAIQESIWLKKLELEIYPSASRGMTIYCDNRGAIQLALNNNYSPRTKHIEIKEKFVREKLLDGSVGIQYLRTDEMPADILTKATNSHKLSLFSKFFGLE